MSFAWLKQYTPRGLYGRAALILLVPIVTLLIAVSVVFIQRHYEEVSRQMTTNAARSINFVLEPLERADNENLANVRAEALAMRLSVADAPAYAQDRKNLTDLSGRQIIETLRSNVADILVIDLVNSRTRVSIWVARGDATYQLVIPRRQFSAANPHQFLVLMAFVAIIMSVIAFNFLRNQLRPIKRLAHAADAFGRGRIEPYRPSGAIEVRQAGNAFLSMRARIERQIEQRTMMLSGVSHDLRTPLTRMKLALSMLENSEDSAELTRDVEEMERLLDEFLAFARGDALDDLQDVDIHALMADVVARHPSTNVTLDTSATPGEPLILHLRPMAIERALTNLIGNADRYATQARVGLSWRERSVTLWVEDDGPGISEAAREEALKPFVRLDAARNQDKGSGVGLGLAITHDIARRHGGSLRLSDGQILGGLRCEIILPR